MPPRLLTIGHSTRSLDTFLELLRAHDVATVADVRRLPGSNRFPHFNRDALEESLPAAGIAYRHLAALGGRRRTRAKDQAASPNGAWRNASFRAYADYLETPEFQAGLDELVALAKRGPVAIMCAEAVHFRCHRLLIADALFARGFVVEHIASRSAPTPHRLTPFARLDGTHVTYPPDQPSERPADPWAPQH